ncbi:ABC transporter ATP-binding protein [Sulfitobacter sp. KE29]|uniref:ABC transporter ATP-binding protein n=1 Tax=unclassified Sulfitobacter TaxID=196795 RepID=UPI0023E2510F|nr:MULTISPECIES: ABC transporter ATP-binding protein [unclassified Sulfitobacter]MDF3420224.1 ABC transporter ATP-binding protein [Sulfitobacter sp. Ks38]MDF3427697.1 ABC transporter ATP-binding protein [Sulfitobacter sp. KE29]MDF3431291.1 ABC transporter ATP-binding protein [Sulfitobacter sp. S46]MDF3446062.1 ABC transporter ATP-binding protein [Sulfitobacter sp. KE31]MDF3550061.1 ABC transporter ATP-binding protein [Sulfitobacter sp. KE28]|tara:strand:+ start:859 stop:1521 length:663 start_codon:yes stop_codon:yes gene_type:complete
MIELRNLSKSFPTRWGRKYVLKDVNLTFPTGLSVALMGRNGAGKSTLLQIIAGNMNPDSGEMITQGSLSFPVGFAGSFHRDLSGAQNTKFIARIYGVDSHELMSFVSDFTGLGRNFYLPVRGYSSGMKARLAFGVSMGIQFDTYLVDEVTSVGDRAFRTRSAEVFKDRMANSGAVVVTHSIPEMRNLCQAGVVLEDGHARFYDDIEEALDVHKRTMDNSK